MFYWLSPIETPCGKMDPPYSPLRHIPGLYKSQSFMNSKLEEISNSENKSSQELKIKKIRYHCDYRDLGI
jgi:hypothetical protein